FFQAEDGIRDSSVTGVQTCALPIYLPMVCTDVGDVRRVVGSTKYCYICNPCTDEFAAKLAEILAHRNRSNGRENIRHLDSPAVRSEERRVGKERRCGWQEWESNKQR